jgi:hypothetical protein
MFVYSPRLVVTANSAIVNPPLTLWPHLKIHCRSLAACRLVEGRTSSYRTLCPTYTPASNPCAYVHVQHDEGCVAALSTVRRGIEGESAKTRF